MNKFNLKTLVISIISSFVLSGCNNMIPKDYTNYKKTTENTADFILPEGLSDCKSYKMTNRSGATTLYVMRCPLSTTTIHQGGKIPQKIITIESEVNKNSTLSPSATIPQQNETTDEPLKKL